MNLSYVSSLFDQLKEMILVEANRHVSSVFFVGSAGSRDFYYQILDIVDAVDSLQGDYVAVLEKFTKDDI